MNELNEILKYGFPYPKNVIMLFIGGSQQHGATADNVVSMHGGAHEVVNTNNSDVDLYGIFIPPKEKVLGIDSYEHFVHNPNAEAGTREKRLTDEPDITLHSLQKWAGMAAKGNPTVISFLFSNTLFPSMHPSDWDLDIPWYNILHNRSLFIAKTHLWPFIYYAKDQMERLMGLRGQKNIHRDKLVDLYGYDTKYAMHIIRLLSEAKELMRTGIITYPRPEVELLKDVRRGKFTIAELHQMSEVLTYEATEAQKVSYLPEKIDRAAISKLIADVHMEFYEAQYNQ